jgi:hypothetical protein
MEFWFFRGFFGATAPQWATASSFTRFLDHIQRRTTIGRTPLDRWSARRTDLYLTTHKHSQHKHPCPRWDSNTNPSLSARSLNFLSCANAFVPQQHGSGSSSHAHFTTAPDGEISLTAWPFCHRRRFTLYYREMHEGPGEKTVTSELRWDRTCM